MGVAQLRLATIALQNITFSLTSTDVQRFSSVFSSVGVLGYFLFVLFFHAEAKGSCLGQCGPVATALLLYTPCSIGLLPYEGNQHFTNRQFRGAGKTRTSNLTSEINMYHVSQTLANMPANIGQHAG